MIEQMLRYFATEIGMRIADSISSNPGQWTLENGGYRIVRHDGLAVWIANKAYGLHLEYSRGTSFTPNWADKRLIWIAVRRQRYPSPRQLAAHSFLSRI